MAGGGPGQVQAGQDWKLQVQGRKQAGQDWKLQVQGWKLQVQDWKLQVQGWLSSSLGRQGATARGHMSRSHRMNSKAMQEYQARDEEKVTKLSRAHCIFKASKFLKVKVS